MSAIERKLEGLSFFFKLLGWEDWTDFWVRQSVKGYRKVHKKKDAWQPVTFSNLLAICETLGFVCTSRYEGSLFKAAFSLAFYGAFRIGELVSPSRRLAGGPLQQAVRVGDNRVCLRLRRSKADQRGRGVNVLLFALQGSRVCPVEAVREFLGVRPAGMGPYLLHEDGSYLSKFQFVSVFRKCLRVELRRIRY